MEREFTDDSVHAYRVALDSGSMLRGTIVRLSPAVQVFVSGPDGSRVPISYFGQAPQEFRAVAPRQGDYRVEIVLTDLGARPTRYGLTLIDILSHRQVVADVAADRERGKATVDWLGANAVRLKTVEAGHGFDDMEPLRKIVGNARVVALGEGPHGTREYFQLKHRMLEFLVTKMGFTVFAMEAQMPEAFDINEYVLTGRGDPVKAIPALYVWPHSTEEVVDLFRWMRQYNANPQHARKVKFYGVDPRAETRALRNALEYLGRVDPDQWREVKKSLAVLMDPFLTTNRERLSKSEPDTLLKLDVLLRIAERSLATFDAQRKRYIARSSAQSWSLARQHMRNVVQILAQHADPRPWAGLRDRQMAENFEWVLEREGPQAKAVVWAHNGHVASSCYGFRLPMGCYMRRALGPDLVVFWLTFNRGGFKAVGPGSTVPGPIPRSFSVAPLPDSSLDATLAQAGLRIAAVDLRAIPDRSPVSEWFARPHTTRSGIGAGFDSTRESLGGLIPMRNVADALLFVDSTSPVHLLANVPQIPQETLRTPTNLDFETGSQGGSPHGWYMTPSAAFFDFRMSTANNPYRGKASGLLERSPGHHYGERSGGLEQMIDATPYRGKWVRLKAMNRANVIGDDSRAHFWLTFFTPSTALDPLFRRTVTANEWRSNEIVAQIPQNALFIRYGFTLVGTGRAWIDDVSLDIVPPPK